MKKQQFIISVPVQSANNLKLVEYEYTGFPERNKIMSNNRSRFPGVPMLLHNYDPDSDAEILFIRTINPENENDANNNFEVLQNEIASIPNNPDIDETLREKFRGNTLLSNAKEIKLLYEETLEKQIQLIKDICALFKEDADLYMDITFGSKVTPIQSVVSLVYAENAKHMTIKELVYGLCAGVSVPKIFNVKDLYRIGQSLNVAASVPGIDIDKMLSTF